MCVMSQDFFDIDNFPWAKQCPWTRHCPSGMQGRQNVGAMACTLGEVLCILCTLITFESWELVSGSIAIVVFFAITRVQVRRTNGQEFGPNTSITRDDTSSNRSRPISN